jgi:hypothetical protein
MVMPSAGWSSSRSTCKRLWSELPAGPRKYGRRVCDPALKRLLNIAFHDVAFAMPTIHVEPGSESLLQEIAATLWKSRKVVVITGAGISTNSGIPVRWTRLEAHCFLRSLTDEPRISDQKMASTP